ncbi:hypothetical protein PGH47_28050 [Streptomyces sp. HUAS 31]|uniref:hypothetical protein n=1 Tax=Streptomyces sp. HUAS 31 TaxID=3020055 RepID=UPI0023053A1D|nr:hypothetical protein [Streptomyces sp. HUAS 31]WCD99310.1 hypothetical protein PGH47_28050 [Streptomyces sp. HUAS 31]
MQERDQLQHAPDDAWKKFVDLSQNSNVKLRQAAQAITQGASGQQIPTALQEHLAAAVKARRAGHARGTSG